MTTPVLLFDINNGTGLQRVDLDKGASYIFEDCILCIDEEHAKRENTVNGAGHLAREVLDRRRLVLAAMMSNDAPTWYNPTGKSASTIDYVAIPLGLWDSTHDLGAIFGVTWMDLMDGAKIDGSIGCNATPRRTQFSGDMGALALMDGAGELCELVGDRHAMVSQGGPAKDLLVALVVSARKGSQRDTGAGGRRGEHGHPSHSSVPHATQAKKTDVTDGIALCEVDLRDRRTSIKVHFDCCSSSCR